MYFKEWPSHLRIDNDFEENKAVELKAVPISILLHRMSFVRFSLPASIKMLVKIALYILWFPSKYAFYYQTMAKIVVIRHWWDCFILMHISIMGFSIPVRWHIYAESPTNFLNDKSMKVIGLLYKETQKAKEQTYHSSVIKTCSMFSNQYIWSITQLLSQTSEHLHHIPWKIKVYLR